MKSKTVKVYSNLIAIYIVSLMALNGCAHKCKEIVLWGGTKDNYSSSNEPREHHPSTSPWQIPVEANNQRNYNEAGVDNSLVQSFFWPTTFGTITGAILEFEAKPEGEGDWNDTIQIYPYHHGHTSSTRIAGALLGTDSSRNIMGLKPFVWTNQPNSLFSIDLKNFPSDLFPFTHGGQRPTAELSGVCYFEETPFIPPALPTTYQIKRGYDLTRLMNQLQFIDIMIFDDTAVDYMRLILTNCECDSR